MNALLDRTITALDRGSDGARFSALSLFLFSFAGLFTEVMMIRWIGTEVRIFAYVQNLALIACFLGFGLGCYHAAGRKPVAASMIAIAGLAVLVYFPSRTWQDFLYNLSNLLGFARDSVIWIDDRQLQLSLPLAAASIATLAVFLLLLTLSMIPLGQWVGHYLDSADDTVRAYSVNLAGSLAGICCFAGMAFLWTPPEAWFLVAIALLLIARRPTWPTVAVAIVCAVVSVAMLQTQRRDDWTTTWSPYQKLVVRPMMKGEYYVEVNNVGYMTLNNLSPELFTDPRLRAALALSPYNSPLKFAKKLDNVLIVGAGGGNDIACALRAGASHVDAVEIDPVILAFGRTLHPERPYSSPKVRAIVNDARAWFRQTTARYDVIVFGLLDSHTQFSDYSNMRIDNYVYTEEAIRDARNLLAPGGVLILKFEVRAPWTWMGDRFESTITRVFGRQPVVYYAPQAGRSASGTVFIASDDPGLWERAATGDLAHIVASHPPAFQRSVTDPPEPTRDDWPYVYQRNRAIPSTFLTVSLILLLIAFLLVRGSMRQREPATWQFLLLGAGFLLMETQLISRLALYFGTTWIVNCVAISAVLLVLVIANLFVLRRAPEKLSPFYVGLVTSLLAIYALPWNLLPIGAQAIGAVLSVAYCMPVFFSGVIFTVTFRRQTRKAEMLGANIFGSVAGGLAQSLSFVVGLKALLLLAAIVYAGAGLVGKRTS